MGFCMETFIKKTLKAVKLREEYISYIFCYYLLFNFFLSVTFNCIIWPNEINNCFWLAINSGTSSV